MAYKYILLNKKRKCFPSSLLLLFFSSLLSAVC